MDKFERRQVWMERVADYQDSGLTMVAWSQKTGHSVKTLRYWIEKLKVGDSWLPISLTETGAQLPQVSPPSEPLLTLQIQIGSVRIDVYAGAESELLREVLQAVVAPC